MIALLVNPAARGGRAAATADAMEAALRHHGAVTRYTTRARGDEAHQVTRALADGATALVVVGGDGAVHHTVKALRAAPVPVPLAICAAGTGNDFVKSLGTPSHDVRAIAAMVKRGHTRRVDLGEIGGVPFCNAAGIGFDVEVLQRMQRPSRVRGTAAYVLTALGALASFRGIDVAINDSPTAPQLLVVFANGQAFGGAFRIAPHANLQDGQLDCIQIGPIPLWQRPLVFGAATAGRHTTHHAVTTTRADRFALTFIQPPHFEADGELYCSPTTQLIVQTRPQTLEVFTP